MRTFGGFRSGDKFFYGEVVGDEVHALALPFWIDVEPTGEISKLAHVDVDLPVSPSKLIAVGLNYADHIREMARTPLGTPLIWFKAPSSLLPHNGRIEIAYPAHQTDFEIELAIVIGKPAKNVNPQQAPEFVFGYSLALDISDLSIEHRQNGQLRQQARTSEMIYSVAQIVSFANQSMTLAPGDVILTGTPPGVGPIHAGDELEAVIDNWLPLRNSVANAPNTSPVEKTKANEISVERI